MKYIPIKIKYSVFFVEYDYEQIDKRFSPSFVFFFNLMIVNDTIFLDNDFFFYVSLLYFYTSSRFIDY